MAKTLVNTHYGQVQGGEQGPISVWKGIPFAQPPTGQWRFLPPQPLRPWTEVLDATQFGPIAIQPQEAFGERSAPVQTQNEDCLTLNIWSPQADDKKRPVVVWIHGGAFVTGSGSAPTYDGSSFAEHEDLVVVTLNYRLGFLGFLYLGELAGEKYAQGNCGLLDQIAALQWVHDNIAAFGGDPNTVTIMGESAGAMSIGVLLAMPAAKGLFQRAILESGASNGFLTTRERATKVTQAALAKLNLDTARVSLLTEVPAEILLKVQTEVAQDYGGITAYSPFADGVTLPDEPLKLLAQGGAASIDILLGTNRDEWRLFTMLSGGDLEPTQKALQHMFGEATQRVLAAYTAARADKSSTLAAIDMQGDNVFRIPAIRLAETQVRQGTKVWMYRFDWESPVFGGQLGACHAVEIPFVWNTLDTDVARFLTGDAPTRQPLAQLMHTSWAAFIRTGNPTIAGRVWPTYDLERRTTLIFNNVVQTIDDPQGELLPLWDGVR